MNGIFLLLGTNIGDRLENLQRAVYLLGSAQLSIIDYSSVYESAPWGDTDQDWFYNIVLRVDTLMEPEELLQYCLQIENEMGRKRTKKWGARIIDIDILYYHNISLSSDTLEIPHPGIPDRKFTLMPLVEIIPADLHPVLFKSQTELLTECNDTLECRLTDLEVL